MKTNILLNLHLEMLKMGLKNNNLLRLQVGLLSIMIKVYGEMNAGKFMMKDSVIILV